MVLYFPYVARWDCVCRPLGLFHKMVDGRGSLWTIPTGASTRRQSSCQILSVCNLAGPKSGYSRQRFGPTHGMGLIVDTRLISVTAFTASVSPLQDPSNLASSCHFLVLNLWLPFLWCYQWDGPEAHHSSENSSRLLVILQIVTLPCKHDTPSTRWKPKPELWTTNPTLTTLKRHQRVRLQFPIHTLFNLLDPCHT